VTAARCRAFGYMLIVRASTHSSAAEFGRLVDLAPSSTKLRRALESEVGVPFGQTSAC
jgi:hypothetical protein